MQHPPRSEGPRQLREWHREWPERRIAGVCAGLAAQLDLPLTLVRAAFVLGAVVPAFSGTVVILYLVLWFLMPARPGATSGLDHVVDVVESFTQTRDRDHDVQELEEEERR